MRKSVLNKKLRRDYAISGAILLISAIAAARIDRFEMLYTASRNHEGFELDDIFSALMVFPVIALVFAIRRISDLKTDIKLRTKIQNELNACLNHTMFFSVDIYSDSVNTCFVSKSGR